MSTTVRFASEADLETLFALNSEVQSLHAKLYPQDFKPLAEPEGARTMFKARLASPEPEIAIAEINEAPVGYIYFEVQTLAETAFNPARRRLYVHHLCVTASIRRQGVATELLRFVERRGTEQGASEFALGAWAANTEAIIFFESMGFTPFSVSLRKRLRPE